MPQRGPAAVAAARMRRRPWSLRPLGLRPSGLPSSGPTLSKEIIGETCSIAGPGSAIAPGSTANHAGRGRIELGVA